MYYLFMLLKIIDTISKKIKIKLFNYSGIKSEDLKDLSFCPSVLRSYEITRKDRLYKNIEAMQRSKGLRNLDFIPQTFLLPSESRELLTAHFRYRGPWIVKPKASSRGRGIYIVNSVSIIISRYEYR